VPTYDYECQKCEHTFEVFQPITEEPLKTCPKCRGRVKRLIGAGAGVIFKGSGFYATDYRSKEYKESAKKEKTSSETSTAKGETSKDKGETSKPGSGESGGSSEKAKS